MNGKSKKLLAHGHANVSGAKPNMQAPSCTRTATLLHQPEMTAAPTFECSGSGVVPGLGLWQKPCLSPEDPKKVQSCNQPRALQEVAAPGPVELEADPTRRP